MKKLFTLVVAAFAAVSVFAQTRDIGEPTNNVKDGDKVWYDATTKVVTFYENGSYRPGWWLASWDNENRKNVPTDFSDYDELVVELENPNGVNVNVRLEYEGADASYANSKGNKIVVPLDKDAAKKVNQAYLQCWDEITNPVTVTFKKAYFSSKSTGSEVVLSDKETALDSWGANINIDKSYFANVKVGDKLVITGKKGAFEASSGWKEEYGGQILVKTKRSGWSDIADKISVTDNLTDYIVKIIDDEKTIEEEQADKTKVEVKTSILKELKEYGLVIQGMAAVVTKVVLLSSETTGISNSVVAPTAKSTKIYNLAGQQVDASYKGVVVKNGKKYVQK